MNDEDYMRLALSLAERGAGWARPNPMVGAVLVKGGQVIGQGWHARCGDLHAERHALKSCAADPRGATLYVTLEPCCHQGRQPPCTDAIIEAGVARVVVGCGDPNPKVAGRGLDTLRRAGIAVTTGVLEAECRALDRAFFHYIQTGRPYVTLKYAMTADGKLATASGASRWITGETARASVHRTRHRNAAILVGVGTVLSDDPLLTCRMEGGRDPVRVVCDTRLRTPLDSQIVRTAKNIPTVLATCEGAAERTEPYAAAGCQIWTLPRQGGHVDLNALMARLGAEELSSVLLEGGSALAWEMLSGSHVQRVQAYIAPKLFGGTGAKSPVGGDGVRLPEQAFRLRNVTMAQIGADFLLEGEVETDVHRDR